MSAVVARLAKTSRIAIFAIAGAGLAANLIAVAAIVWLMAQEQNGQDWKLYVEAGRRAWAGLPIYDWSGAYEFRYSPILAYLFGVITPLGLVGWRLVALASLLMLPRRLALVAVVSAPLWLDLYAGNLMTLVFVLAACAIAGQRWAIAGFLIATLLVPRPLMLPVAAWLLWKLPQWRGPFALAVAVHAVAVVPLDGLSWLRSIADAGTDVASFFDFGPARFIGVAWIPIGVVLASWLTWQGRLGFATLAASPYWLPYYPLMLLLELAWRGAHRSVTGAGNEQQGSQLVPMDLATARFLYRATDQSRLVREKDRIRSARLHD